jgi:predicted O-linked N-acetylglucosamine transferase (SPINDLY family)
VPAIDYYISTDQWEPADGQQHYSEKLVCLKNVASVAYYYKPAMPDTLKPRSHFLLNEGEHIYICPQALFKLHPQFDEILGGILRGDPTGKVVLVDGKYPHWSKVLNTRFEQALPDVVDRIQFVPRQHSMDFINLIAISDVMLDTIHFCGFNTTLEAFAAGVPVVTLPGQFMRGRHTAAFYTRMDIPECVAGDMDDYIEKAIRLGTDMTYREEIGTRIKHASEFIWEETAVVREFERAFEIMISAVNRPHTDPIDQANSGSSIP